MEEEAGFRDWVLGDPRYLSFLNELEYYAGLRRNDLHLLNLLGERFASFADEVQTETGWSKDLRAMERFRPPHDEQESEVFREIECQLQAPRLRPEERDEMLEGELPRDVGHRQDVFRPIYREASDKLLLCLFLYSGVLKNSELVPDSEKRRHLTKVLEGWGAFTYEALLLVPALAEHRKFKLNGVVYHVNFPENLSRNTLAKRLCVAMPRAVSEMMRFYLSTEKLQLQLQEPSLDEAGEPRIVSFYRACLYGDMRLEGFLNALVHRR